MSRLAYVRHPFSDLQLWHLVVLQTLESHKCKLSQLKTFKNFEWHSHSHDIPNQKTHLFKKAMWGIGLVPGDEWWILIEQLRKDKLQEVVITFNFIRDTRNDTVKGSVKGVVWNDWILVPHIIVPWPKKITNILPSLTDVRWEFVLNNC